MMVFSDSTAFGDFLFVTLFFIPLIATIVVIVYFSIKKKYKKFVLSHSISLKELRKINERYKFKDIPDFDLEHSYDNENMYNNISCKDYLTYELVYIRQKVVAAANDSLDNKYLYKKYREEVKEKCKLGTFDNEELPSNNKYLKKIETECFYKEMLAPITVFCVTVTLTLTTLYGHKLESKEQAFFIEGIREIITKLKDKNGSFYRNREVWDSICRVERGKVSNKMRFAIYERDGYRCRKCGRKTDDLEIDHIIPISRGGKSTYDNLQTLCRRCNLEKGSDVEED